jgi:hypothetical protein
MVMGLNRRRAEGVGVRDDDSIEVKRFGLNNGSSWKGKICCFRCLRMQFRNWETGFAACSPMD